MEKVWVSLKVWITLASVTIFIGRVLTIAIITLACIICCMHGSVARVVSYTPIHDHGCHSEVDALQMIDGETVVAIFYHKGVSTLVEIGSGIEIVEAVCSQANILHPRRNVDLATPYARTVSASACFQRSLSCRVSSSTPLKMLYRCENC